MNRIENWRQLFSNGLVARTTLITTITVFILILGNRHFTHIDLTATARHTLLPQSIQVLGLFDESLEAEVFISPNDQQRALIDRLLNKYMRHKI